MSACFFFNLSYIPWRIPLICLPLVNAIQSEYRQQLSWVNYIRDKCCPPGAMEHRYTPLHHRHIGGILKRNSWSCLFDSAYACTCAILQKSVWDIFKYSPHPVLKCLTGGKALSVGMCFPFPSDGLLLLMRLIVLSSFSEVNAECVILFGCCFPFAEWSVNVLNRYNKSSSKQ